VNPKQPHRRWSQATERLIVDNSYSSTRIDTQKFNGYEAEIAYLYEDIVGEDLWH
jgi:methionine sulfoxide reductase catalytic subunit